MPNIKWHYPLRRQWEKNPKTSTSLCERSQQMWISLTSVQISRPFILSRRIHHQDIHLSWLLFLQWKYTRQARSPEYSSHGEVQKHPGGGSRWKLALQLLESSEQWGSVVAIWQIDIEKFGLDRVKIHKKHNSRGGNDKSKTSIYIPSDNIQEVVSPRCLMVIVYINLSY